MISAFVVILACCVNLVSASPSLVAEWVTLNYTWDATHDYQTFINEEKFIPNNCLMAGINVDINGDIYVTVPRWRNGVPATLNKVDLTTNTLTPFPSWDMQREGVSGDLQNVQSMTIDSSRRMWIIEVGRRNFFLTNKSMQVSGPAGLWCVDLLTNTVISQYYFPSDVVSYDESFLNDIVIDETRNFAYLTDAWGDGAIITFDLTNQVSRRYSGPSTQNDPTYALIVNGVNYGKRIFTTPSDGIAMTSDAEAIFYCQVQGTKLYRLPTSILRDFTSSSKAIDAKVEVLGTKTPSDGMKYLNGVLYYGSLTTSTYYTLTVNATSLPNMAVDAVPVEVNTETMQWLDTFAIDLSSNGTRMYFVSNKLDEYSVSTMDFSGKSGANMHIMRFDV